MREKTVEIEELIKEKFNILLTVSHLNLLNGKEVLAFIAITPDILNENKPFKKFINKLHKYITHEIDYIFYNPFVLDLTKCSIETIKNLIKTI